MTRGMCQFSPARSPSSSSSSSSLSASSSASASLVGRAATLLVLPSGMHSAKVGRFGYWLLVNRDASHRLPSDRIACCARSSCLTRSPRSRSKGDRSCVDGRSGAFRFHSGSGIGSVEQGTRSTASGRSSRRPEQQWRGIVGRRDVGAVHSARTIG